MDAIPEPLPSIARPPAAPVRGEVSADGSPPVLYSGARKIMTATASEHIQQRPALTEAGAQALLETARAKAADMGVRVAIAVVDPAGRLLAFRRMDGAPPVSVEVSVGKARSAVEVGAPSGMFETMINAGETAMLSVPGLVPLKGGEPIMTGDQVAGAIGISGSSGENDAALAQFAAHAFQARPG